MLPRSLADFSHIAVLQMSGVFGGRAPRIAAHIVEYICSALLKYAMEKTTLLLLNSKLNVRIL